jgi:hypothetical protein
MSQQLDLFAATSVMTSVTTFSTSITGLTVKLDRPADLGHRRCGPYATIGSGRGIHWAVMTCASCGRHRGWLGRDAINFINETRARFGAPEIIVLRNRSIAAGAGDEADIT